MKKSVFLVLALVLVFTMASLTGYGADKKQIEFVTWSYGVETIADNNKKFSEMYPDIQVNHKDYSWLDYHDTMVNRFVANNFPDVMYGSDHWLDEWASAGWLVPLEDYFPQVKNYSKEVANYALQGMTYKGKIYGMSYYADTLDFMYNKAQLEKAGFKNAPATWEEVYQMAKVIKQKGIVQYPIIMAWSQKEGAYPEAFMSMVYGRHQGGAAFFDSKLNPVFNKQNSDAYVTIEWLRKAYKEKLLDPASLSTAEIDQIKSMQAGAHTFTIAPQYNMAELNKPNSGQYAGQFRIALMPGKSHATVGYVRFYAITPAAVKKGKDYLDAVWKYLEYSAGKTNGEYKVVERWAVENGLGFAQLPLFNSSKVREAFGKWGDVDVIKKQAELARAKEGMTTWYGAWDVYTRSEIHKAILGQESTMAALNNIAAKWKELKAQ
ncbi:MAG: ABC transporter substrate-binding protein [Bacillota bacterium]